MPDEDEILSLKWNKHNSTFLEVLAILRDQESFVDVTLACGGRLFPAHQFILSTCSDYFKEMFRRNPCKHPIVYLKDVPARDLEALLDFMYRGEVDVAQTNLGSLMNTAEGLQVKGLALPDGAHLLRRENFPTPTPPPRPPPDPTGSPPLKRKRFYPIAVKNMLYNNFHNNAIPEPNSPYDLSQKSSSLSSSVSQSDLPAGDRPHSSSPPEAKHPTSSTPASSQNHHEPESATPQPSATSASSPTSFSQNKENSADENNGAPKAETTTNSPRTPQPTSSSSSTGEARDPSQTNHGEDGGAAMPGPSGTQGGTNHTSDENVTIKEDVKVDVEESWDWSVAGGGDSGGGSDGGGSGWDGPQDGAPPNSDCSNSSFSTSFDPALDLSAKPRGDTSNGPGGMLSPRCLSGAAPPAPTSIGGVLLPPRPLWPQDGNIAEEILNCPICGKHFPKKRKSNLQVHLRTHTNERPFKCSTCSRSFKQKAHLEKHQEKSCHVLSEFVPYPFFPKMQ